MNSLMGSTFGLAILVGLIILGFFLNMFILLWFIKLSMNFSSCRHTMKKIIDRATYDR